MWGLTLLLTHVKYIKGKRHNICAAVTLYQLDYCTKTVCHKHNVLNSDKHSRGLPK